VKITVICHEIPLPPNHGGRVDMWRRLLAFARLGVQLQIISWSYEPPEETIIREIQQTAPSFINIPIKRQLGYRLRRLPNILQGSLYAALRWPEKTLRREIVAAVQEFNPDCLWLDGFHGGLLACYLEERLGVPFFYRSQNIEHVYLDKLRKSSRGLRSWLVLAAGRFRLRAFEKKLIETSLCVYDISLDDMAFWQRSCKGDIRWLPPLLDWNGLCLRENHPGIFECDVLFLGNLNTENNIFALRWFLEEVVPQLLRTLPQCRIWVAGSKPVPQVRAMCERVKEVSLLVDPEDAVALLRSSRVLVNPAQRCSGVNLKSLDMLAACRPVVSTSQGVTGLPREVKELFFINDSPEAFAKAILGLLENGAWHPPDIWWLSGQFGLARIESLVSEMRERLAVWRHCQ